MKRLGASELLKEARELSDLIGASLPIGFDIAMLTFESKLPFKALSYREALIHRFSDLASSAVEAAAAERPIATATLTRGCMETMARTWELQEKIAGFLSTPNVEELDSFLMARLFGSRNNPELPSAPNILGAIDKTAKDIPEFRKNYDQLSELVHPNYSGTLRTFAKFDKLGLRVTMNDEARRQAVMTMILASLVGTLHGLCAVYNMMTDSIAALNSHFESQ